MPDSDRSPRWLALILGALVAIALAGALALHLVRSRSLHHAHASRAQAAAQGRRVYVSRAKVTPGERTATLPGDVRPFLAVTLTARVSGYLKTIEVDKGDVVKSGRHLATLETPDLDAQVLAAQHTLIERERVAMRARALAPSGYVAKQDLDIANGDYGVAQGSFEQTRSLQQYKHLEAPFDGVVTARYADPGALLQPGTPLVDIQDPRRLRVTVYAGQDIATFLKVGDRAEVVLDERPEQPVEATVSRLAQALDPRTRTMLVEVWVDNTKGEMVPGSYAHVTLHAHAPALPVIPSDAVVTRDARDLVAVVSEPERRLHLLPIEAGLNDGRTVQIKRGLQGGEQVVVNLPMELGEGSVVQPVPEPSQSSPSGAR